MASQYAVVVPISLTRDGETDGEFYTQYYSSRRTGSKYMNTFSYDKSNNSLQYISCSRVSYDKEHDGFSFHIEVRRSKSSSTIRLYSATYDNHAEADEDRSQFLQHNEDKLYIVDEPYVFTRGENITVEVETETENISDGITFTNDMKHTHSFYVGVPVYETMLFTDKFDTFSDAVDYYQNGLSQHGVDCRIIQQNADGSSVVRFGDLTLWAFNEETEENYFFSRDLTTLIHEDEYDIETYTGNAEDVDYVPSDEEVSFAEQEAAEALVEMQNETVDEVESGSESENEGDTFMFDLSEMRLKPYGKGYLLIPDKADDVLAGTKYFLGGWWMPNQNAWFFKEHLVQDLVDLGAKKMRKVQKDRTGLNSRKVFWKKLDRGYALVPKEDYKHYGKETFRGGKWWKNGNAWFFTDNARERYIAKYGKTATSKTK